MSGDDWFEFTPFVQYDQSTGEILSHGAMSVGGLNHLAETEGWHWLPGDGDPATHFVADGAIVAKSACPAVLNELTLSNLPQPCQIEIWEPVTGRQIYTVEDDSIELEFDHPGTYQVRVLSAPHLPGEFVVTVP